MENLVAWPRELLHRVEAFADSPYGIWPLALVCATGIAGLTPLPYKIFTLSGGAFSIDFKSSVLASAVSRSLRFFAVAGLVAWLGEPAREVIDRHLGWLTIAFVILLIVGFWLAGRGARRAGGETG